ncbi:MAG: SDR family NAD(P)-dependent oxidoreductase [Anaerolineae bacterium]|nr:MAG: SDR family NAD(P)-dependent oxidoreductase [Anaerolineae bacterium]
MRKFQGQTALITGGSSGIGLALARMLAAHGANVWLLARREDALANALQQVREVASSPDVADACGYLRADVTNPQDVQQAVERMQAATGTPDLLINSAGVARPGYAHELPLEVYRTMMEVNYFGTLHVIQALLPHMLTRGSGHIVNISSLAGIIGVFGYAAYGASKFAVTGLTDVLRAELKPRGIRVSLVLPPDTDTPQLAAEEPYKPPETKALAATAGLLSPEQVAEATLRAVARGRYLILPGTESKFTYLLSWVSGPLQYALVDFLLASARRRM